MDISLQVPGVLNSVENYTHQKYFRNITKTMLYILNYIYSLYMHRNALVKKKIT